MKTDRKKYSPTCLGLGLDVTLFIMRAIIRSVLLQEEAMSSMASAFINKIYVTENVGQTIRIREHLAQFGLECKDLEWLRDEIKVIELAVEMEHSELQWKQGSVVPDATDVIMWQ